MFKRFLIIALVASAVIFQSCSRNMNPLESTETLSQITLSPTEAQAVQATNNFSFTLFKNIVRQKPDSNVFISPFSVSMALSMALNGANGQTFDAMRATLGFEGLSQDSINQIFDDLYRQLQHLDSKVIFNIANSIWYDRRFNPSPNFIDVTKRYFHAEVNPLDFADPSAVATINHWVDVNTNGKIKQILSRISRDEVLFILNALYFKGTWQYAFDKKATKDGWFFPTPDNRITCKMMQGTLKFFAWSNDQLVTVQLPYGKGLYRMAVIMPQDLQPFIDSFDNEQWQNFLVNAQPQETVIKMPKFRFSFGMRLNDVLKAMGMGIAFDAAQADFSRLAPNDKLFITRVDHKAFVDVNESGTEAAAVTNVGFGRTAVPMAITIDHPFIFVIYEKTSGTILFMGLVRNPVIE